MPTYEYRCNACGHAFEKFQSMSAKPVKTCPSCGKDEAQRQISAGAGFIFKGGGFYETDYRSDAYKKSAEADKAPSADAKTDAKPDAKSGDAKTDAKSGETKSSDAKPAESKPAAKSDAAAAPAVSKPELSKSSAPTPPPVGG